MKKDRIARALGANRVLSPVALAAENIELRSALNLLKRDLAEHKRLFEIQHERSRHADILWREHTGNPNITPDLGTLLDWLIERGNRWRNVLVAAKDLDGNFNGVRWEPGNAADEARWIALRIAIERHDMFYEGIKL